MTPSERGQRGGLDARGPHQRERGDAGAVAQVHGVGLHLVDTDAEDHLDAAPRQGWVTLNV